MKMTRREFLGHALTAGAVAALARPALSALAAEPTPGTAGTALPTRILGRTGQAVTILGLGCAYIADKADEAKSRETLEAALEGGIRLFDTSADYGQSEERLGPALAPMRDKIFLVTKINGLDFKSAEADLMQSLKRLKTDHVDLLFQHGVGLSETPQKTGQMLGPGGSLEFLRTAKKKGLARFIGMSMHPANNTADILFDASEEWDVIMPFINYVAHTKWPAAEAMIAKARRRNLGVVGMKTLGGQGQLADDYDNAFRYVLSVPGVACALVGVHDKAEVQRAVKAAREFRPLTDAEMADAIHRGAEMLRTKSRDVVLLEQHAGRDYGAGLPA